MADKVLVWLLVENEGAALLVRRKDDEPPFAGQWVLPGDEMPEVESAAETLLRVGKEELGVEVSMDSFVTTLELTDSGDNYSINVFRVAVEGRPRYRESGPYEEAAWAEPTTLPGAGLNMSLQLLDALVADATASAADDNEGKI